MQICRRRFNPILMQMTSRGLILSAEAQLVLSARRVKITAALSPSRERGAEKKLNQTESDLDLEAGERGSGSFSRVPAGTHRPSSNKM